MRGRRRVGIEESQAEKWGGEGEGEHLQDGPSPPSLIGPLVRRGCVSASSHLQAGLIVWGLGPLCVGNGASLAGHQFVIICSLAPDWLLEKGALQGPGHRSLCHNFCSMK